MQRTFIDVLHINDIVHLEKNIFLDQAKLVLYHYGRMTQIILQYSPHTHGKAWKNVAFFEELYCGISVVILPINLAQMSPSNAIHSSCKALLCLCS